MTSARVRKSGSSLSATLAIRALIDSASMRAWAGSYTPQGRSQWAETSTVGANSRANILGPLWEFMGASTTAATLLRVRWSRRWGLAVVTGDSMRPTLLPGDRLLVQYGARP